MKRKGKRQHPFIVTRPRGGLCNRLQAMAATYTLSRQLQCRAKIIWIPDPVRLNAGFSDLFSSIRELNVVDVGRPKTIKDKLYNLYYNHGRDKWIRRINNNLIRKLEYSHTFENKHLSKGLTEKTIKNISGARKVLFTTGYDFVSTDKDFFNFLSPKDEIKSDINNVLKHFNRRTIGIHIRRTDHRRAISGSPVGEFIKVMEREIKLNDPSFFLATDDDSVKSTLIKRFGDRVIINRSNLSRGDVNGMIGAVVDLFALSHTRKIYGSRVSSFARTSAEIGDIDLIRVYPKMSNAFISL